MCCVWKKSWTRFSHQIQDNVWRWSRSVCVSVPIATERVRSHDNCMFCPTVVWQCRIVDHTEKRREKFQKGGHKTGDISSRWYFLYKGHHYSIMLLLCIHVTSPTPRLLVFQALRKKCLLRTAYTHVCQGHGLCWFLDGLAGEEEELAKLVERLDKASTAYGMELNVEKTKLMPNITSGINTES